MISFIIPLYNCKKYITRAIESVLKQTYLPKEIIVVNDGSTDNGEKIVEEMHHPLIKIINKKNGGVSSARNTGINEARGEFIAFTFQNYTCRNTHTCVCDKVGKRTQLRECIRCLKLVFHDYSH